MALGTMGFTTQAAGGDVQILYNSEYVGDAITLDTTAFTDGVCKAGTPLAADGKKAATNGTTKTSTAFGILLHDVYADRPQGTVVIGGYIDTSVAQTHSGVTYDAETKAALNNVVFM